MTVYICSRCNYSINHKRKFISHLHRKYKCKPIYSNISTNEIYEKYFKNREKKIEKNSNENVINLSSKCQQNVNIFDKMSSKCHQNVIILSSFSKEHCKFCKKEFKSRQSRWRHEKKTCKLKNKKMKKKIDGSDKDKIIEELLKKINEKERMRNTQLTNLNLDPSNNCEVKLNPFSETDRSHLTDKDYLMAIKKGNMGLAHLIMKLHFNEKKPENHNICMTNTKNNLVKVYTKHKSWEYQLANETVNFLVEDNANFIEDKIAEWRRIDSDPEDNLDENNDDSKSNINNNEISENDHLKNENFYKKHEITDEDVLEIEKNKKKKRPKHKYGGEKYESTLEKFPRLLDRLSNSTYVRKIVHDQVRLVLYNKRAYALKAEKMTNKQLKHK